MIVLDFVMMTTILAVSVIAAIAVMAIVWGALAEIGDRLGSSWPPLYPIIGSILFWAAVMALAAHLVMA